MKTERIIRNFKHGIIDAIEDISIPDGAASASLNWLTMGDKIEVRRGMRRLGSVSSGYNRVSGLWVGEKADGTEVLFAVRGTKAIYFDTVTEDWIEIGTNIIPAVAVDIDVSAGNYASLAGAQTWFGNEKLGPIKIMVANPGSYASQYLSTKNFKGRFKIKQNRMVMWGLDTDKTGLYGSYIDAASYTTVTAESVGTGNGTQVTFTGTLAFKAGGARRTCFAVSITDGVETFTDDFNGVLTGSAGGTGTINYMSGAFSVTFAVAPLNLAALTAGYQWEDSTNNGIADFTKSAPRTAGQGFVFRQDDGGGAQQAVESFGSEEYCFHEKKTWVLELTADDTDATNDIYREKIGVPNLRAAIATEEGIYHMDDTDPEDPKFRLLRYAQNSSVKISTPISGNLDLTDYRFDQGAVAEFGNYILFACRRADSASNDRVIVYDRVWNSLDVLEYSVSCFAVYAGTLVAGDSTTGDVYEILSGFDDDDFDIVNSWEGNLSNHDIEELKKTKRFVFEGLMSVDQEIQVYAAFDRGAYVLLGSAVGDGSYVDRGSGVLIGSSVIGSEVIGGGSDGTTAYPFTRELRIRTGKYDRVKIKIKAVGSGYAAITTLKFRDILRYGQKLASKYRT